MARLARWLQRAVDTGLICQEGSGRRADPFTYWLPEMLAKWQLNPMYAMEQEWEADRKKLDEMLNG
jgi:hypothetical protein